jgi:two-component system KDP operon response regulator KdpE
MLTAHEKAEEDIVRGLDYGADEYLAKLVGGKELVARVRAVMWRAELPFSQGEGRGIAFSDDFLTADIAERRVMVKGERVRLTPVEFRLLALLLQNAGRILTHKQLLEKVWGWEYIDDLDYVRIYIWHLRQKIEPDPAQPRYIITEPGVGYYFRKAK